MAIDFLAEANALHDDLIERRRDFHQHPELAFEEHRTAGIVADELNGLGLEVQTGVGQTGVVGILEGAGDGPTRSESRGREPGAGDIAGVPGRRSTRRGNPTRRRRGRAGHAPTMKVTGVFALVRFRRRCIQVLTRGVHGGDPHGARKLRTLRRIR